MIFALSVINKRGDAGSQGFFYKTIAESLDETKLKFFLCVPLHLGVIWRFILMPFENTPMGLMVLSDNGFVI